MRVMLGKSCLETFHSSRTYLNSVKSVRPTVLGLHPSCGPQSLDTFGE